MLLLTFPDGCQNLEMFTVSIGSSVDDDLNGQSMIFLGEYQQHARFRIYSIDEAVIITDDIPLPNMILQSDGVELAITFEPEKSTGITMVPIKIYSPTIRMPQ